ncbi:murein hydrolase activator EnvC [Cellulomonas sp. JZ18]|uniref:murein hydrolase activator EnvC family protein n=1 Tax=Cellulomonas sp. JZ18 TaxID=2654191 RepID=UPI001E54FBB9|nr:M23 family metallopeptidase [Cellulomonas sp. JZ18]
MLPAVLVLAALAGGAVAPPSGARPPAAAAAPVTYRPPVGGVHAPSRPFEAPPERWLAGHRGVDLSAEPGTTVVAPADGVVTFAGPVAGRGVVTVLHADGRRSSVEPVTAVVVAGTAVRAGDALGTLAEGGHCRRACLHWGVREGERYVDPWSLLPGSGPVVLLPVP